MIWDALSSRWSMKSLIIVWHMRRLICGWVSSWLMCITLDLRMMSMALLFLTIPLGIISPSTTCNGFNPSCGIVPCVASLCPTLHLHFRYGVLFHCLHSHMQCGPFLVSQLHSVTPLSCLQPQLERHSTCSLFFGYSPVFKPMFIIVAWGGCYEFHKRWLIFGYYGDFPRQLVSPLTMDRATLRTLHQGKPLCDERGPIDILTYYGSRLQNNKIA